VTQYRGTVWEGSYFDGRVAQREPVTVEVTPASLWILRADGGRREWPYAEIRQTQGARAGDPVRLERGPDPPEVLVLADPAVLAAIREAVPQLRSRFANPAWRVLRGRLALAGSAAVLAIVAVAYFWGIPLLAARVAARVPVEWEERLGRSLVAQLAPDGLRCDDPERQWAVQQIVDRLVAAGPPVPYTFRIAIVDDSMVNALAAPGGYIVVYRGLLQETQTPEELAGVLAHEIQHVVQRHGTQAVLEEVPLRLVVAAVTGDAGRAGRALGVAATLGRLRYRRRDEAAADRAGMRMLQEARIAPDGMIRFFTRLDEQSKDVPALVAYLSTHPRNAARIAALERLALENDAPVSALNRHQWGTLGAPCPAPPP